MTISEEVTGMFHYDPSKALASLGIVVFGLFTIYFAIRLHKSKGSMFLYILPAVTSMECIGFAYRLACINSPTIAKYINMIFFTLLPARILSLVNYMAIGKVIRLSKIPTEQRFYFRPNFVTWFFFAGDIILFWVQRACDTDTDTASIAIILVALSVQSMLYACFLLITVYVHQNPIFSYQVEGQPSAKGKLVTCVYVTFALLYVRSMYRVAEYVNGFGGAIASLEWAFYFFDGLALVLCFLTYSVLYIGDYLPNNSTMEYSCVSDTDQDEMGTLTERNKKNVAVFNNVQSVNYSINVEP